MLDVRPVLFVNGFLLLILAAAMALPGMVDALDGDPDWLVFLAGSAATAFVAGLLVLGARPAGRLRLEVRSAFLLSVSGTALGALCAALPFVFSGLDLSFTDAVFEATSGLTTTGATVIAGLDHAPRGILLWRALLNWLGGFGFVALAVAILPSLRIGGMQLFRMESSDRTHKVGPRIRQVAGGMGLGYAGLTALSAAAFWLAGMTPFDAICHAMAALSTGGFSTSDASLAHWGAGVQWVAVASMLAGAAPLPLLALAGRGGPSARQDSQLSTYLGLIAGLALLLALWRWAVSDWTLGESLRYSVFSVTSVATTTGFVTTDWSAWGGFAQVVFFLLAFVGGCTGSTAGGIKIFRWQLLVDLAKVHVRRLLHPHGVFVLAFNRRPVSEQVADSVLAFVVLYIVAFVVHALLLTLTGLDLVTALSGSAAALGNLAHGLGNAVGPAVSWKPLPSAAKWILAFEMLVGRLEVFTVLVLFTPGFWKR